MRSSRRRSPNLGDVSEERDPELEAVVAAFYAAFDNRGSRGPDAQELLALFGPEATVTRVAGADVETWSAQQFVAPRIAILTDGTLTEFHEWETESRTFVSGSIAARWSTYEKESAASRGGGQKVIHLRRAGGSWVISSLLW